ncbi:MAG: sigma-70 family RNA polymerase sigma factor [Bacteroidia bacterium]|nr:sigma-70 family RNA polymerase sigma factor [Bacteroidia bacterium]
MEQFVHDDELISRYQFGEEDAISDLVDRHKKRVFSYIMKMVGNRQVAEDIFQETFFKVIRTLKKDQYNGEGKFIQWVLRIAHNLMIDHFRQNTRLKTISKIKRPDGSVQDVFETIQIKETSSEMPVVKLQMRKDIRKLVECLPKEQKEVVMLRHYYSMSFKEIADMTNVSINTALGRMRYALFNLRRLAEEQQVVLTA